MNQLQINSALNNEHLADKKYLLRLASLWKLAAELKSMEGFTVNLFDVRGNVEMVNDMPEIPFEENYSKRHLYFDKVTAQNNCRAIFGVFTEWQTITLTHSAGSYCFHIPANNKFHSAFLEMIGAQTKKDVQSVPVQSLTVSGEILPAINKAIKFISKDGLRPVMQHVCLHIEDNLFQVVSTDAHRLYYSKKYPCNNGGEMQQIIIPEAVAKQISKAKKDAVKIDIFEDGKANINGIEFTMFTDAAFPNFKAVIPDYVSFMTFNKEGFASNIRQVIPYANKRTSKVNLHLNGSIALHCEDIDFCFEATREMPYINKNFPDTDIAFNGKFLLDACGVFKEKELKMFTEGVPTRAGLITNGHDTVLLMPLMM